MKLAPEYKSRASARKHRIYVLRDTEKNVSGFVATAEESRGPFWASVQPLSERMRVQYNTISVTASHTITAAGSIDVLESDRIKFRDKTFEILTIRDADENGRDKIIITQEIREMN